MSQLLSTALKAAQAAGDLIKKNFNKTKVVNHKNGTELFTNTDIASEKLIRKIIKSKYPDHNFVTEELADQNNHSDYTWYIDPIDGTHNFIQHISHFCVSIGLSYKKKPFIGVIFDPIRNEFFTAQKGKGAYLNKKKIKVSNTKSLKDAFLITGIGNFDDGLKQVRALVENCRRTRYFGSTALDLSYIAAGRLDGSWQKNVKSWDMAAGIVLIEEAGGKITDYDDKKMKLSSPVEMIASNKKIKCFRR